MADAAKMTSSIFSHSMRACVAFVAALLILHSDLHADVQDAVRTNVAREIAAAGHIPPPLPEQLKPGGRMVISIGIPFVTQQFTWVKKNPDGRITTRRVLPVRFAPLTGGHRTSDQTGRTACYSDDGPALNNLIRS